MTQFDQDGQQDQWKVVRGWPIWLLLFSCLSGCSIWESNLDPDYQSTRAERLCHPYGDCSQGEWIAINGNNMNFFEAKEQCDTYVNQIHGNGWWQNSVSKGLEVRNCMEKKGFVLQQ